MSPMRALLSALLLALIAACEWNPPLTDAVTDAGIGSAAFEDGGIPDGGVAATSTSRAVPSRYGQLTGFTSYSIGKCPLPVSVTWYD